MTWNGAEPKTWTAAALAVAELPEPRETVPGLLVEGLTILAARPKIGKSWLMLAIGAAIAQGAPALGVIPVETGDVLYIALEDTERRMKTRLRTLLGVGRMPTRLSISVAKDWPRADAGGIAALELWLMKRPETRLVVIDTWAKFRAARQAKDTGYSSDYADIEPLQEMAGRRHVSIVLVHHLRKATAEDWIDQLSGTLGLAGAADGLLGLFRSRGESSAVLKVTGRDLEEKEYGLRFDADRGAWSLLGSATEVAISVERQSIVGAMRQARRSITARELAAITDRTLTATQKLLSRMQNEGQVTQARTGWYELSQSYLSPLSYVSEVSDLSDPTSDTSDTQTPFDDSELLSLEASR